MSFSKPANTDHEILDVLAERYSPYLFEPREVPRERLATCFEAARWAPSSFNEQPWRFLIAERSEQLEFQRMLGCLLEANQVWAESAGVLMLTAVSQNFSRNGKPNRVAIHDLGLAMANFTTQATQLGLAVHQMAGVNLSKIRSEYSIPEGFEPVTAVAVGYPANPQQAPQRELAERDLRTRSRNPFDQFVFHGSFGKPAGLQ